MKDNNKRFTPPHVLPLKKTQSGDEVIVHGSITIEDTLHNGGKNTQLKVLCHKRRFFLHCTPINTFVGGCVKQGLHWCQNKGHP
jgi:hypothetical protein